MEHIAYKKGYKYQIVDDYDVEITIKPDVLIVSPGCFVTLTSNGLLRLKAGYAWDGPSGPAIDTLNFMRGSLVHDALYQLMRQGLLSVKYRRVADSILQQICIEDGMSKIRAWYVYQGLKFFGHYNASTLSKKRVITAPGDD